MVSATPVGSPTPNGTASVTASLRAVKVEVILRVIGALLKEEETPLDPCLNLSQIMLNDAYLWDLNFKNACLAVADLTGATLVDVGLTNAQLIGIDLTGVTLSNTSFAGSDITGADRRGADLTGSKGLTLEQVHQTI